MFLSKSAHTDLCDTFKHEDVSAMIDWICKSGSPVVRRNREQIIDTFPLLLPALVHRSSEPEFIKLTADIDGGRQLIEAIASLAGVKKKTVRFLRGIDPSPIGRQWTEDPLQLFRILDVLPDHRRPKNGDEWRLLAEFWQYSLRATNSTRHDLNGLGDFGWHLFVGLCTSGYIKSEKLLRRYLRHAGSWAGFANFVRDVGLWCESRAHAQQFNDTVAEAARDQIALELLTGYPAIKLLEMAEQWQQSIIRDQARTAKVAHWPALLPDPIFCDGLSVISLTDSFQLFKESQQLNHCVSMYNTICLLGEAHILAIRDEFGDSLSTAEITLVQDQVGEFSPVISQHAGANNSLPDVFSSQALAAAMHRLREPDMQNWFRQMIEARAERQHEIDCFLLHEDCDHSDDVISEIFPCLDQVEIWLEKRFIQEELWHYHQNDLAEEAAVRAGLGNLYYEDAYELWNEDQFRWGQYERMIGR